MIIDKGDASSNTLHKRMEVVKSIQEVDKLCAMEASQKEKIKWAIEGDENSKYYHVFHSSYPNSRLANNLDLEAEVSNEEIKKAVWDCGVDKSPGAGALNPEDSRSKNDIVNEVQSAFVADIQILDGPFILNEDYLDDVLRKFGFGEKMGVAMSKLLGIMVSEDRVVQAANRIGCGVLKNPCAYLGSKVGGNMSRIKSWDEIVDKMVDRLFKWKMKHIIDQGGRLPILKMRKRVADSRWFKSIWRSILQEVETLKIKDMILKQRYPRLYALEVKKTVDVASKLSQKNLTWSFCRVPRSGVEQDQLTDLTNYVEVFVVVSSPDRWYWTLDGSGEFSVASARKVIDDNRFSEVSTQTRWIKAVPIKVNIHAWKVRMDCLPTRLNISRR
ncbi:hypothetical protein Tco_0396397, partial [Tanacetum coccineum]